MTIKELIASKLRPVANAVRRKKGTSDLIPVDDLEKEIDDILSEGEAIEKYNSFLAGTITGKVIIPYGVTEIRPYLFYDLKITEVELPLTVSKLGESCFKNSKLSKINLSNINTIGDYTFDGCVFETLDIPESLSSISRYSLQNCTYTNLYYPKTLTMVVGNNKKLTNFFFKGTQKDYLEVTKNTSGLVFIPSMMSAGRPNFYFLNDNDEFELCETFVVPENIIINNTFPTFAGLKCKEIIIPETAQLNKYKFSVYDDQFSNCEIETIKLPNSITSIGGSAFSNAVIKYLEIGSGVTSISASGIAVKSLDVLVLKCTTPPSISYNSLNKKILKIFVPIGTRNSYISATNWSAFADMIYEPNTINLSIPSSLLNNENYTYSIDNGTTWNQFTSELLNFENINVVRFKNLDANTTILVGTTEGGSDIGTIANAELMHPTSADQTIYLTVA